MTVRLFDSQVGFGGATPGTQTVPLKDLADEMARLTIDRALVRIAPAELDGDVARSNEMLFAAAKAGDRLVPCPVVVPSAAGDFRCEPEQVDQLIARGAGAVVLRPALDCWHLAEWASGSLFRALQGRRLPTLCLEPMVSLEETARLAEAYPELPLIVGQVGYRELRGLVALMRRFDNVSLSIGSNFAVHRGIEGLVDRVGPERLLFGTGFPEVEPMMAVTQLMYAEIGDGERRMIGAENLQRLIGEVRR